MVADEQRGQTQDFVMINHPVFFARNVKDYLRLEQVIVQADDSSLATLQGALTGGDWNPLHWHWREMLAVARMAGQLPAHPASNTYFSMAPIRFGKYVAKYRAKPAGDRHDSYLDLVKRLGSQADAMRLASRKRCEHRKCCLNTRCNYALPANDAHRRRQHRVAGKQIALPNGRALITTAPGDRITTAAKCLPEPLVQRLAWLARIVPWEASTASAAGPTPSRPRGVVGKPGPSWQSRQAPVKSVDNI